MLRRLLKESLVITGGTLFFLALCATVGISTSTPPSTAGSFSVDELEDPTEDMDRESSSSRERYDFEKLDK
jgi:hypothetical protein